MDLPKAKRHKPNDGLELTLPDVVNWENPENIAIEYHESLEIIFKITYNDLNVAKNIIEDLFIDLDKSEDENYSKFIGISSDIPELCVPALMLGINSSNRAFVCFPSSSVDSERLSKKLSIDYLFVVNKLNDMELIKEFSLHNKMLSLQKFKNETIKQPDENFHNKFSYAVTTSGSTGVPKLIKVTHSCVVPNILDLKEILNLSSTDKISQLTPLTFDPSVIEIFMSLSSCGTIFIPSKELKNHSQRLMKSLLMNKVTIIQSTPSLLMHRWSLKYLKNSILSENSHLRILLLGGELLKNSKIFFDGNGTINNWRIFNIYGISEVSCWSSINEILPETDPRNLGNTLSQTIYQIRNDNNEIVNNGDGVLYIGSNTRICLIDDEIIGGLNFPVFRDTGDLVRINENGELLFNGRNNRRVKRFGERLDLQYFEDNLNNLDFVENSCALLLPDNQRLHVFLTVKEGIHEVDNEKIKIDILNHSRKLLSIYCPDEVHIVERFPITNNGKISFDKLREICNAEEQWNAPNIEMIFKRIWRNYLGSETGCFVDLGGTSVIALQIANEISERSGNEYPELIGRMLRNENFEDCRIYISREKFTVIDEMKTIVESSNSKSSLQLIGDDKIHLEEFNGKNDWLWQKCRGKMIFNEFRKIEAFNSLHLTQTYEKVAIKECYDLMKCVDASPTLFCWSDKIYATVGSHSGIICTVELRDDNDGETWRVQLPDRIEASILIVNSFRGIVGCYDGFVYCIDLKSGGIIWRFKTGDSVKCTAAFCSERRNIFIGSYDHYVYCISSRNGSQIWKRKVSNGSISATPLIHKNSNSVFFSTLDGTCISLEQRKGNILWRYEFQYPIFSSPVISNSGLIIFCDVSGRLGAFDIENGKEMWMININGNVFSHLTIHKNSKENHENLIVTSKNKNLYNYSIDTTSSSPKLLYKIELSSPIMTTPWVNDNSIILASTIGELFMINAVNANIITIYKLPGEVYSSPVAHNNFIVIGCRDNNFYIFSCQ